MGKDCGGNPDYSPLQSIPAFWNRLFTHHSGAKYRTIMCRIRHSILFCSAYHFLYQISFYFCSFSFDSPFFLFKSIKIGSHKHLQDFLLEKCHHCHCFLCYFVFMELLYPVIWLHFFCYFTFLTISKTSSINFSNFICNYLKTIRKIQCRIQICFLFPVRHSFRMLLT